ncbi:MAG: tRNA 2-thiouridine(34) synthase MnmA [Tissierellia bacterium]|nr:tRNA 2-thiouridine(34) synthase MnmA [Tissierellia bacterium]
MVRVLVGMSGGVDSTAAAIVLKESGYEVLGVTMLLIEQEESYKAIEDAKYASDVLGIEHIVADFRELFQKDIISDFVNTYKKGITPNPCIRCNMKIKFGELLKLADKYNCELLSTGHYAKVTKDETGFRLKRADDINKDQSYFLYNLNQEILKRLIFPIEDYTKAEVRKIVKDKGIEIWQKKDSEDVCFIPDGDTKNFLKQRITDAKTGNIVDEAGKVLGKHEGIEFYTVGQRRGLGIAAGKRVFVKKLDIDKNEIVLCENENLFTNTVVAADINFVNEDYKIDLDKKIFTAKTRYSKSEGKGKCRYEDNRLIFEFEKPQRAVAKGQSLVVYDNDFVICGGIIVDSY